jgi:glycosyltransferase involved in cell wall biosynthesis
MLGRIAPEKGHLDFVRAAHKICRSFPLSQFVVYGAPLFSGSRYESEIRRIAAAGVEFRGWTDDVSTALHDIDILAVPSVAVESTPRVILEAMSAGTPVVAYPSGGIPELIRTGETGLLAADSHPEALVGSISELQTNRDLMRRLAANARCEWERRFTLTRFVKEICDSLTQIVEQRSAVYHHEARQQNTSPAIG